MVIGGTGAHGSWTRGKLSCHEKQGMLLRIPTDRHGNAAQGLCGKVVQGYSDPAAFPTHSPFAILGRIATSEAVLQVQCMCV